MKKQKTIAILAALGAAASPFGMRAADLVALWDFEKVEADGTTIKASVGNYSGQISGDAILTDATGGRPGGGKGFDVSQSHRGWLYIQAEGADNPMTAAAANDSMTVTMWSKNNSNINSSDFWASGPGFNRAFQFHIPWSNGTIYFDTSGGCCATPGQRLQADVVGKFPDHDWTAWHHYAFVKDGGHKAVYVDGNLLVEQADGADPLPTEYSALTIGGADNSSPPDAVIDEVGIWKGALTDAEILAYAKGKATGTPPVDTDKDGMPDDWEKQYGFNPNDPSDAAKDFDKDGVSNLDEFKAGTNPTNTTPPTLVSAVGSGNFTAVTLAFDDLEVLDQATAENPANYSISPALTVVSATLKKKTVTLVTAAQTPGATKYTVTVTGVKDLSKNAIGANNKASFYSYLQTTAGVLKFSYWGGIGGTPVQGLYDDPRYPATPDQVLAVYSLDSRGAFPDDSHENYGATIEGFLTPTESGSYRFFVRSDDASQFYLSTDDKEANLSQIAEEIGCCKAFTEPDSPLTSEPVALVANKKYFVRLVYKEGGGGDYGQVAWRKEGDKTPAGSLKPIPGQFLSSAASLPAPPEGAFTVRTPGDKAKNVSPATGILIGHRDGKTAWTAANTSLKVDGNPVTPTFTKVGTVLTLDYKFPGLLASASAHTVTLSYLDAGGNPAVSETTFTAGAYAGPTLDKVGGYPGLLLGSAVYTADAGGHTAKAGDYGVNLTLKGGPVATYDAAFLAAANAATAKDELTVAFWQKKLDVADSSAFTLNSPSAGNHRGFHAHVPWSNQNVYFDTTGCCDGTTQRISADIATFPDYTGTGDYWTSQWHFFVFTKKGADKNIWIDGKLFLNGSSTNPLLTDHTAFYMGSGADAGEVSHAIIDDFSVFGKALAEADILALKSGTLPTALAASKGLLAYWDYNDAVKAVAISNLKATVAAGGKVTITFDGAGTIQSSDTVNGSYADTAIKSGDQITVAGGAKFYRAKK